MFLVESLHNNSVLLVTVENKLVRFDSSGVQVYEHGEEITSAYYLPKRQWLVFTDITKKLIIVDHQSQIVTSKVIQKRAAKLIGNRDETVLILGDKTGDVYSLSIADSDLAQSEFKLIMGHLSMLTDLKLTGDEKYLLTADRDEKLRISSFPNAYNIHSYLLAHKEFLSQVELLDQEHLITASGDSSLILWNMKEINPVQTIHLKDYLDSDVKLEGIDRFEWDHSSGILLVHPFGTQYLLEFKYDEQKREFSFEKRLDLGKSIDAFTRLYDNFYLFAFLHESSFAFKKLVNHEFVEAKDEKIETLESLLTKNVNSAKFEELQKEMKDNYLSYFKSKIDNISEYYERKQERIMATSASKRKLSDGSTDPVPSRKENSCSN